MNSSAHSLKLGLEDLLADLWHARRQNDLGRLALLTYCDMRRWARVAHEEGLAERACKKDAKAAAKSDKAHAKAIHKAEEQQIDAAKKK